MVHPDKSDQFLSVIQAHKGIIYKVANSYCRDPEDRKDLAQEIIVQLWKAYDTYDSNFKYSTWLYRIALNVAISFGRKERSRKRISHPLTEGILEFSDDGGTDERESDLGLLQQAIAQLRDLDKALVLLYLEERPHREIAHIMGMSETNVATKINRIKQALKLKLNQLQHQ